MQEKQETVRKNRKQLGKNTKLEENKVRKRGKKMKEGQERRRKKL